MTNPYLPPTATVADVSVPGINDSGTGKGAVIPAGVKGWSWGAFFWNWIWAIGNRSWIGLLALVPYAGILVCIYLGFKGREMAWRNKRWNDLAHFNRVQRAWTKWALIIFIGVFLLGILAAIAIPAYQQYMLRARSV